MPLISRSKVYTVDVDTMYHWSTNFNIDITRSIDTIVLVNTFVCGDPALLTILTLIGPRGVLGDAGIVVRLLRGDVNPELDAPPE